MDETELLMLILMVVVVPLIIFLGPRFYADFKNKEDGYSILVKSSRVKDPKSFTSIRKVDNSTDFKSALDVKKERPRYFFKPGNHTVVLALMHVKATGNMNTITYRYTYTDEVIMKITLEKDTTYQLLYEEGTFLLKKV